MFKGVASQKWTVIAWNSQTGEPVTGDAANITGKINIDEAGLSATNDTNPTEGEGGHYAFDLLTAETAGNKLELVPVSATADVIVIGLPAVAYTRPPNFSTLSIESDGDLTKVNTCAELSGHTAQSGDAYARIGASGASLSALPWNASWDAEVQSECADALTAYDPPTTAEMFLLHTTTDALIVAVDNFVDTEVGAIKTVVDTISTNVTTIDDLLDTEVAAIKTVVDRIEVDTTAIETKVDTVDDLIDTEVAAIKTDTAAILVDTSSTIPGELNTMGIDIDGVDAVVDAIKVATDKLIFTTSNQLDVQVISMATNSLTSSAAAADFIGAAEIAASASTEIADLIAADWVAGDASPLAIVSAIKADAEWSNLSTISGKIDTIDTVVDRIEVDTTSIETKVDTVDDLIDTEVAAIKTAVDDILVDTAELQTDDVPGLISALNNISTSEVNSQVDAALADYDAPTKAEMDAKFSTTDDLIGTVDTVADGIATTLGTAGAGLTDLGGMSTGMKAEVNTEVDTALGDYDSPTKAEMDAAHGLLATEAKQDIIDVNVDQIETAVITNAAGADIAADIISLKAETVLIVADTNELQADDIPGALSTLSGKVDVVDGIADAILVDTNELQSDDVPGLISTLDAVVDTVKAETALIVADTNELQADDMPGKIAALNNISTSQVNTEVDTALSDYDGPTKAEMDTGHGLLATEAKQDIIDTNVDSTLADTNELQTDDVPGLIAALNNISTAQVNTQVDNAMVTYGLDHLVSVSVAGSDITDNSIVAKLVSKESTADWDDFVNTTDSLQAIADAESSPPTAAVIADAVWDETQSSHTTSGSFGEIAIEIASTLADSNELQGDDVPGLIAALNNISTAQVNAEADTALSDYDPPTKAEMDTAHGLLATEAKQDVIDANVDQIETAVITNASGVDVAADIIAIKAQTVAIEADTTGLAGAAMRGTDSAATAAELAKVPKSDSTVSWNATALAAINAEADTALSDYDAPTKAEMDSAHSTTDGKIDAVDDFIDTEIAAIKTVVDEILVDTSSTIPGELNTMGIDIDGVDAVVDAIKVATDKMAFTASNQLDVQVISMATDSLTATAAAADFIGAAEIAASASAEIADLIAADWVAGDASPLAIVSAIKADAEWSSLATIDANIDAILTDTGTSLPATLSTIDTVVDSILADTSELQTDDIPGTLSTISGKIDTVDDLLDTEVAAIKTDTAAILVDTGTTLPATLSTIDTVVDSILADTAELQTDDIPGSLSTISGKIDTVDGIVDSILGDTAVIGAAGAGLTDLGGMSTGMKAEVNAEADTALSDYDAPTKAEMDTAHGLLATEAKQDVIDSSVDSILADTNELQTDDVPGLISALNNISTAQVNSQVDTALSDYDGPTKGEMDTAHGLLATEAKQDIIDANVDSILADTNELQSDNIPGSLSTISGKVDVVDGVADAILVDTAEIGTAGAGLTEAGATGDHLSAIPWNSSWDTEVQSECADALVAYDPPTKAEMDTAHGLLATEAKQDIVDTVVDSILVDTNELQVDWANGGRLDLILDTAAAAGGSLDAAETRSALGLVSANLDTQLGSIDTVVDRIEVDTTSIETKVDTVDDLIDTEVAAIKTVVDLILVDTDATIPSLITAVDDYVDTEVAAIKVVTDRLDDTLEDSSGTFRFTTASLAQSQSTPTISQVFVPSSRVWVLVRGPDGGLLSSGPAVGMQVGEDLLFAADFHRELGRGDWVSTVSSIAIDTGTADGVTFDTADQATNGSLCKFSIVAVTAGTYTIRVKVVTNDSQTIEGDCSLKIVAA